MSVEKLNHKINSLGQETLTKLHYLASFIDHTNLKPDATQTEIEQLCNEAIAYGFKSVCVQPCWVKFCKNFLKDSNVLVCTVVGFPLGQNNVLVKAYETLIACNDGADEIDLVINLNHLKTHDTKKILAEIQAIKQACGSKILKVIVETCLLSEHTKMYAIETLSLAGVDFIKTSTGFSANGALLSDIIAWNNWRKNNYNNIKIKAAGGIKSGSDFMDFIENGADRIGTSKSVFLIDEIFGLNDQKVKSQEKEEIKEQTKKEKIKNEY